MRARVYTAEQVEDRGIAIVRLADVLNDIEVAIAPSIGNRAYEMLAGGKNILYFPHGGPSELIGDRHLSGIPFLAPWGNRMPGGFYVNGRHYPFNPESGSLRLDQNGIPIHGMLISSPYWRVVDIGADAASASVTSRLEFWKYPDLVTNWPFAHEYEMTHRLADGTLEVSIMVTNLGALPMPIAVGFHPYFQLPEAATAHLPVRSCVEMDERFVATGLTIPVSFPEQVSLEDHRFDTGFTDLTRGEDERAVFSVEGGGRKIEVAFGPRYTVAIVYAPPGENYICFEPMSAVTNGINLAHEGKYAGLQTIASGESWRESFWIRPAGFNVG
ncbi:MAG TPA: aldose 1-epimerase [Bryobacteraceae bacterium]|jgi:aldose 1-epimerase|nr:aldose 1-epimerase [Bryobacteraceae bacterium]